MPPDIGASTGAHRPMRWLVLGPARLIHDTRGALLLSLVMLVLIVAWYFVVLMVPPSLSGSVSFLVRGSDGTRTVERFDLATRTRTPTEIDARAVIPEVQYTVPLSDGTTVRVDTTGVIAEGAAGVSILIASPVPASLRTPFAVATEGAYIAWVNPADQSTQVFERTDRGTYVPVALFTDILPNSLAFTDTQTLVAAVLDAEETHLFALSFTDGTKGALGSVPGAVTLIPLP